MLQDRRKQFISLDCIQWVLGELEEKTTVRFAYCSKKVVPELIWINNTISELKCDIRMCVIILAKYAINSLYQVWI